MDKRYQVFVSSTYEDLQEERQEVMHALLELDCMPSGMELFPAANEDQWSLIKKVIDDCDYYIVIIGGRYGSVGPDGISYTEMEYQYALKNKKPIIAFLHKDPDSIIAKKTEQNEELKEKLLKFRELCQNKMCKTWANPSDLGSVVSRSLIRLIKSNPVVGWVKADQVPDQETSKEILKLKHRIEELENELIDVRNNPPKGTENLSQGEEEFKIHYELRAYNPYDSETYYCKTEFSSSWNSIFTFIAPILINEATEYEIESSINNYISYSQVEILSKKKEFKSLELQEFKIIDSDFQTIKVQLRALGLIMKSEKQRSIKDNSTYWTLTPYGDTLMTKFRAIHKDNM